MSIELPRFWCETHEIRVQRGEQACAIARRIGNWRRSLACCIVEGRWVIDRVLGESE